MAEANVIQHRECVPDGFVFSGPLTAICRLFLLSIYLREISIYFENLQSLVFSWNKKRIGKIESFSFPFLIKGYLLIGKLIKHRAHLGVAILPHSSNPLFLSKESLDLVSSSTCTHNSTQSRSRSWFYLKNQPSDKNTSNCSDHNMKKTSIATWWVNEEFSNNSIQASASRSREGSWLRCLQFLMGPRHFGNCKRKVMSNRYYKHVLSLIDSSASPWFI